MSPSADRASGTIPRVNARPGSSLPGLALVAVLFWGASFVAVKIALESFHPFGLTALRLVLGTGLVAVVQRARGRPLLVRLRDLPVCLLLGLILGAHLTIQAWGLLYTSAIHTGWIIGIFPAATALGAHVFLHQRLRGPGWIGVVVATGGVLLVTLEKLPDLANARLGDLVQLSSCLTWTAYTLVGLPVVARNGALRVTGFVMAVAAVVLAVPAAATGFLVAPPGAREVVAVLFLGLLCSGMAYALWYRAQHVHGAHRVAATLYVEPFVTLAVAMALLDESIAWTAGLGGAIVLLGVWLVGRGSAGPT